MATPNNMPTTNPLAGMNVSNTAKGLYVDPTPGFQPALDVIAQQRTQANERYAQNKADIANIFGALSQVNQASEARVNQQFENSIANQQMATAQRVAEARTGAAQTQQAAIAAADERGGGPMGNLAASPVAVEAERGIANQNALQALFQGEQGAIRQQTLQDIQAANRGLGFQQVAATQQLGRSLEDVLMGLTGREADVRSQLGQARTAARSQVAQANYNEIMSAREAAAQLAAARAAAASKPKEYSRGSQGILERISDAAGPSSAKAFSQSIADVLSGAGGIRRAPGSVSEAMQRWIQANPDMAAYYQGYANQMFADVLSKSIPSGSRSNYVQSPRGNRSTLNDLFGFGQG